MSTEKSAAEIAAANAQPGHFHSAMPVSASVAKPAPVAPPAIPAAAPKVDVVANTATPKTAAAKAVSAVQTVAAPTHVLVPVETLKAIHAQLSAHADTVAGLLPTVTEADAKAAIDLATASRLKQQAVQGK